MYQVIKCHNIISVETGEVKPWEADNFNSESNKEKKKRLMVLKKRPEDGHNFGIILVRDHYTTEIL